jgi:outer membrane murein-binding lipoprotein Lpp
LPSEGIESVRYAENIRAYPLARYIDPNNARIMHEGHTLYRVENTPKWNLHPNQPVRVPLGPVTRILDSAKASGPLSDELTVELNRQREVTRAVIQGGQVVSQKLDQLTTSLQQTRQVAAQNAELQQEVNTTKQRLDALEDELRRKQRAERSTAPVPAQKDDKSEW